MVRVGAVILAAGSSSRFGEPKQLLEFRGELLVQRVVRAAEDAGCSPVLVVTGESHEPISAAVANLHPLVIRNENWSRGIGSSIRAGVEQLTACEIGAVVLLACDQPAVESRIICALIEEHERSGRPIVASHYAHTPGVPALFHRSLFDELLHLPDNCGAKMLFQKNPTRVAQVAFPGGVFDLDTPEDLQTWQERQFN